MKDTIAHTILGAMLTALGYLLYLILPAIVAASVVAGLIIFLRELTQKQTAEYDDDFFSGWAFWSWSNDKSFETWIPIAIILILSVFATL